MTYAALSWETAESRSFVILSMLTSDCKPCTVASGPMPGLVAVRTGLKAQTIYSSPQSVSLDVEI